MTLAMMNAFGNATTTIIQQFAYPVLDAPQYQVGFRTSLGLICGMVGWVFVVRYCETRVQRTKSEAAGQVAGEVAQGQIINVRLEKVC
jgi:ACS family pantothenate transporter-like MFS transporter